MVTDEPACDLTQALRRMSWRVLEEEFALVGFDGVPLAEDLALLAARATCQLVREGGETTLLLPGELLAAVLDRHPGARVERGLRWIRFDLAMSWELTGFLALVTGTLARAGVPLGAVCGFSRDHVFVADRYLARAKAALAEHLGSASTGPP